MEAKRKLRVLFIASVARAKDGMTGGLSTIAIRLFYSRMQDQFEHIALEPSIPPIFDSLPMRFFRLAQRFLRFLKQLPKTDIVLALTADGLSIVEKGAMCVLARLCNKGVAILPVSGYLEAQIKDWWWMRQWLRLVFRCTHFVFAQGENWRLLFIGVGAQPERTIILKNAVIMHEVRALEYGGSRRPCIFYAGWMIRLKGIFEMVDVMSQVLAEFPSAQLVIAGDGPDRKEFESSCEKAGIMSSVVMRGWLSDEEIRLQYMASDIFLLPSHAEGMPNTVLEAMSHGVPVVSTCVGSVPELIVHGESGFLADVGDAAAMAESIRTILRDPQLARRIGKAGWEAVRREHDVERIWPVCARALHEAAHAT